MLLSGCAAVTPPTAAETDYAQLQRRLGESPRERAQVHERCVASTAAADARFVTDLGEAMDVDDGDVPEAFCARLITGIVRGQLDQRELAALRSGDGLDPATLSKFARIVSDPGLAPDYRPLD